MKNKIFFIIVLFIVITFYLIYSANKCLDETEKNIQNYSVFASHCQEVIKNGNKMQSDYLDCETFLKSYNKEANFNFYVILSTTIINYVNTLAIIMILIIDVFAIIWINKVLKNNYVINFYTRTCNKSFLKKMLKESYVFIIPVILSFVIFFLYVFKNTNLILNNDVIDSSIWSINTMKNPLLFVTMYLIHLIFFLGTYINLGLIMSRKNYNYILSLISTYLLFILLELFDEIVIDRILKLNYSSYLSIVNCFVFDDRLGMFSPLLFPMALFVITLIIVICLYKNKEKLYLDCEVKK